MVVPRGHMRIVVWNDADLPRGRRQISRGFGLKVAETRRQTLCATTMQ